MILATNHNPLEKYQIFNKALKRRDLAEMFANRINAEREGTAYKPLSASFILSKLTFVGLNKNDMIGFYQTCASSRSFGARFFYELKVR